MLLPKARQSNPATGKTLPSFCSVTKIIKKEGLKKWFFDLAAFDEPSETPDNKCLLSARLPLLSNNKCRQLLPGRISEGKGFHSSHLRRLILHKKLSFAQNKGNYFWYSLMLNRRHTSPIREGRFIVNSWGRLNQLSLQHFIQLVIDMEF